MITTKQQAIDFFKKESDKYEEKHSFNIYGISKLILHDMLDEIFIDREKENESIEEAYKYLKLNFTEDELKEISNCLIGTKVGMDEVTEYVKYKKAQGSGFFKLEKIKIFIELHDKEKKKRGES